MRPCHSILFTALRKKCPFSEFFWSECGKILTSTDIFQAALLTREKFRSLFQRPYIPNFEYVFTTYQSPSVHTRPKWAFNINSVVCPSFTKTIYETWPTLTAKMQERRYGHCSGVFTVYFGQISHIALVFPLLAFRR